MAVRALGYVGLGAADVDRWATFATRILGLQTGGREPDGTLFLRLDDVHHRIAVHPDDRDDLIYAGWEVEDAAALYAVADRLRQAGREFEVAPAAKLRERRVGGLLTCNDPDGIGAEIFWGPLVDSARPFQSPRAIGFVTGDGGVGHIVVTVRDAEATMHFYRDVLGLRVSDFIEFERTPGTKVTMAFLHCNSRHHSLAFMQLPAPKRLSHLMLEARELDDVGRTYTLCETAGVPIAMTLGRHTNDDMFSFYMTTPSGFNLEFGWGGKSVDDAAWQVERYDSPSVWGHRRRPVAPTPLTIQPERIAR
jgi:2,3-dihydroxybiphenyl 1,2-dioxygenase